MEKGFRQIGDRKSNQTEDPNPFIYGDNDAVGTVDYMGLATIPLPSTGTCGPDVTTRLDATLLATRTTYDGWGIGQKCLACSHIFNLLGPYGGAKLAWDVLPFLGMGALVPSFGAHDADTLPGGAGLTAGTGDCRHTLMYKGKCYKAGLLNYIMWGTINKKCSDSFGWIGWTPPSGVNPWSLASALVKASLYKALLATTPISSVWVHKQVAGCVTAGYTTSPVGASPFGSLAGCSPGSGPVGGSGSLNWVWEPNHHRLGQTVGW